MNNRFLFIVALLCSFCCINAQNLMIKGVTLLPNDKSALQNPQTDSNGDTCALIKIKLPTVKGELIFPNKNQYITCSYKDGIYMIYVPTISRRLDYRHLDYLPGQIDFGAYGYRHLKAGKTYVVQMEAPSTINDRSLLIIKVNPVSARVSLNGSKESISSTGIYEFTLQEGIYNYSVTLDDYVPLNESIQICKGEDKTLYLDLKPITHPVNVRCNVSNARVIIDNVDYGKIGVLNLPQGNHRIRIQGEGYLDYEEDIYIQNGIKDLSYQLKKNRNIKEIHAIPVRIYSKSASVYKNNKRIKEWSNGATIMFMPGKYILSDSGGNEQKIEVLNSPLEIYL